MPCELETHSFKRKIDSRCFTVNIMSSIFHQLTKCLRCFTPFSQWICILYIFLCLQSSTCRGYLDTNYPSCSACSKQVNIPCVVKDFNYHCIPPGDRIFSNKWPGPPRDLRVKVIQVPNSDIWRAVFTWKPPYDASVDYLKGFYITVNYQEETGTGVPYCYYLNLTSPDWRKQPDAINAEFTFDCLQSRRPVRVMLDVKSMPRPHNNTHFTFTSVDLPGNEYEWKPLIETKVERRTKGARIAIWFYPCYPGAKSHVICLNIVNEKKCFNRTIIEAPNNTVIFEHVPCKFNYTVMVRPLNEKSHFLIDHYLQSKQQVECHSGPPVEPLAVVPDDAESISKLSALIVVPVVIIIAVSATAIIFCRRTGRFEQLCSSRNRHEQDSYNAMKDRNNERLILPIYYKENTAFEKCVSSFIQYLEAVGDVKIYKDEMSEKEMGLKLKNWLTGEVNYDIMIILSNDLIRMFQAKKQSLDLGPNNSIDNNNNNHLVNQMYDLLDDIDNGFSDGQKLPIFVSFFAPTGVKCLNVFENVGHIFTVVEDDESSNTCMIKEDDMRQLLLALLSKASHDVQNDNLPATILAESSSAKTLIRHLQNIHIQTHIRPKGNIQHIQQIEESKGIEPLQQHKGQPQYLVEYTAPVSNGIPNECGCHETSLQHPSVYINFPSKNRHNGYSPIRNEYFPNGNNRPGFKKGVNACYVRLPVGYGKSPLDDVSKDETRQSSVEILGSNATESCIISEDIEDSGYHTKQPEQAPFLDGDFLPPDSDEELDNVSLPQRIADINKRQISKWQCKT